MAADLIAAADVDVVHICTPNATHAPLARQALEQGKAVVCEKPLATSVEDARALVDAARAAQTVTAVPFVYRFHPLVREVRARIAAGEAGRVWLVHGSYLQDWLSRGADTNWRMDPKLGGASRAFGDVGVHWCDLMEFATGQRIVRLCARSGSGLRGALRDRGRCRRPVRDRCRGDRIRRRQPSVPRTKEPVVVLLRRNRRLVLL